MTTSRQRSGSSLAHRPGAPWEALTEITRLISRSLAVKDVAAAICEGVTALLGVMGAAVLRRDQASADLVVVAASGELRALEAGYIFPAGTSVVGASVRDGKAIATADLFHDPRFVFTPGLRARIERLGYRAGLALPLIADEKVIGAIGIVDATGRVFSDDDVKIASAFADHAAVALLNAELFDRERRARAEAEATTRMLAEREAQLRQSRKMEALGQLASGVAHELRNPLTVIDARLQLLERQLAAGSVDVPALGKQLASLQEAAGRMTRIVQGLSAYSRPSKTQPVPLNVRDLLTSASELVAHAAGVRSVSLELDAPADLPAVLADRSEMMQVLVNLATNGIEAMGPGGRLVLRGRVEPAATGTPGSAPAVVIEVEDSGPGIAEDTLATIWEPFYTTKAEGTGLGLSIVRGLVRKQPGASISVESARGKGTTFALRMPSTTA